MKNSTAKLSANGQIVIPRKIRESMGLKPGARLLVSGNAGEIVLKPIKDDISQTNTDMSENDDSSGMN